MVAITVLPILALLVGGFIALIVFAIVRQKWALLFIPLGLLMLLSVLSIFIALFQGTNVHYSRVTNATVKPVPVSPSKHNSSNSPSRVSEYNSDGSIKVIRHQPAAVHASSKMMLAPVGLVALMGLAVLVVLVVIAIVRKKWALLFIPLGVGCLLFIGLFTLRVGPTSSPGRATVTQVTTPRMPEPVPNKPIPAVWSPGIEKEFKADNHYSKRAVLRGIAVRVENRILQRDPASRTMPKKLALIAYKDEFLSEELDEAIDFFQKLLPETQCKCLIVGLDPVEGYDARISLAVTQNVESQTSAPDRYAGKVEVKEEIAGLNNIKYHLSFFERPWLENFAAYANSMQNYNFSKVYSQNPARTQQSAKSQAETQALELIKQKVLDYNYQLPQHLRADVVHSIRIQDLYAYGIIFDEYTQSLSSDNSNIWRHAILLNINPDRLLAISQNKTQMQKSARQSWAYHIFSAIGIALVICVIYLILNAATKGYYTAVLRILTVIGIIVVVLVLLNMT